MLTCEFNTPFQCRRATIRRVCSTVSLSAASFATRAGQSQSGAEMAPPHPVINRAISPCYRRSTGNDPLWVYRLKASPTPALEVPEAEFLLELTIVPLD